MKKGKEKSPNAAGTFYTKHTDKFTSPEHKMLALLVKANTARGERPIKKLQHSNFISKLLFFIHSTLSKDFHSFLLQSCSSAANFFGRLFKTILPFVLPTFL